MKLIVGRRGLAVKNRILANLNKAVTDLKRVLDEDVFLEEADRLFIENHLVMLQAAYAEWKTRSRIKDYE